MKTALFIHSYAAATQMVERHWKYYKIPGFEIFGVGRTNSRCVWPENVPEKKIGVDAYISGDNLPRRLVDTFRWFVEDPRFEGFTHACVIEPDGIFLRPPPVLPQVRALAHRAGAMSPPMKAKAFWHCPWWLTREGAREFVNKGDDLLVRGEFELGNPDFFFGLAWEEMGRPGEPTHLDGTFSRNSLDIPADRILVRDRIRRGEVWFVHGVKTQAQLDEILS